MAVIVVISTPSGTEGPDSTPRRIFVEFPDIELQVESFIPTGEAIIPYFWAWGERLSEFEEALKRTPEVKNVRCVERVDTGAFFSVEWTVDDPLIDCLNQVNGAIMEAYGTRSEWSLTIWFEDTEDASTFQQCCNVRNVPFDVKSLRSVSDITKTNGPSITPAQREALVLAYERGFYNQPRAVTQAELAWSSASPPPRSVIGFAAGPRI